jgi:hypothetical protein
MLTSRPLFDRKTFSSEQATDEDVAAAVSAALNRKKGLSEVNKEDLRVLLLGLLRVDPNKRFTIEDVRNSRFFASMQKRH